MLRLATFAILLSALIAVLALPAHAFSGGTFDYSSTASSDGVQAVPVDAAWDGVGTKTIDTFKINGVDVAPKHYRIIGQGTSEAYVRLKDNSGVTIKQGDTVQVGGTCSASGHHASGSVSVS